MMETKYELRPRVVLNKTTIKDGFIVAFTDGEDCKVSYGLYELIEKRDTMVFKCIEGLSLNRWNCNLWKCINTPLKYEKAKIKALHIRNNRTAQL